MASTVTRHLKIDVTSDILCPFCLLGMQQLKQAVTNLTSAKPEPPVEVDIHVHPFQLRSGKDEIPDDAPPTKRKAYYQSKFGSERYDQMVKRFNSQFNALGLGDFNEEALVGSSHRGHRLLEYARQHNPSEEVPLKMDLLKSYHIAGKSPADPKELSRIAVKHGLFPTETAAEEWIRGNEFDDKVRADYKEAFSNGVSGVPFVVFQDKYAVSGAVGVDSFEDILNKVLAAESRTGH